jgi:heme/copper-type cytochrome/quinol oxidase subunit 2
MGRLSAKLLSRLAFTPRRLSLALLALAGLALALAPLPGRAAAPAERHFRIEASSFAYTPAELRVNHGDHVTIELASTDVVHGLSIDGYGLSVTADPGQTKTLSFTAGRAGSFRFRCSVTCGPLHPFMIGKLRVGDNTLLWRAAGLAVLAAAAALLLVKK